MERIEREIIKARGLIVDFEIKNERASKREKETRVLFRAVERIEREIMENLEAHLTPKGWKISTLIHDEIVVQQTVVVRNQQEVFEALARDSKLTLRRFEEARGWAPGTIDANFCIF